jgi:hypothetical protein
MAKAAELNIDIIAHAEQALGVLKSVKDTAAGGWSAMKTAGVAAAGAIVAGLGVAAHAAMEHEVAVSKLKQAYLDAGVPTRGMAGDLEEVEKSARRTGQSTDDLEAGYTKLVTATRSTEEAHKLLAVAQDLAAFKGISVADATTAVIKANEGNTKALKTMGIATTDATGKALTSTQVMQNLTKAVHGQADAYGDTASGEMARYHESLDQIKVSVGEAVLPALKQMLSALMPVVEWLTRHQAIVRVLVPILGVFAAVILTIVTAIRIWTIVQVALDAVLSSNPIGLIILAIAALVGGVIYAYTHFKIFRDAIADVWSWIKVLADWVMGHWKLVVDVLLGPLGVLLTNLGTVKQAIEDVINALEDVGRKVQSALGWLGKIPKGAGSLLSHIPGLGSLSAPAPGVGGTPVYIAITATPGSDLPQVVYDAMKRYQRQHARPELRPLFG